MAYSAVGSALTGQWSSGSSVTVSSVNPTTVGDILVVFANPYHSTGSAAVSVSSLSHSGVTTWNKLVAAVGSSGTARVDVEIWWGVVTATGSATLTVNLSSSTLTACYAAVQQFHSSVAGTWTADVTGNANTTGTSGAYPSITPVAAGEIFLGAGGETGIAAWGGSTSGFTYASTGSPADLQYVYNLSAPSPSSPNWTLGSSLFNETVDGFLYVAPTPTPVRPTVVSQAVNRAATYFKRASGLWEPPRGLIVPRLA